MQIEERRFSVGQKAIQPKNTFRRKLAILVSAAALTFTSAGISRTANADPTRVSVTVGGGATDGRPLWTGGISLAFPLEDRLNLSGSFRLAGDGRETVLDYADASFGTPQVQASIYSSPSALSNYGGVQLGLGIKLRLWRLTIFPHVFWGENRLPRAVLPINYGQNFLDGRISFWAGGVFHLNSAAYQQGPFVGAQGEVSVGLFRNIRVYVYGFFMMVRQVIDNVSDYAVGCWSVRAGLRVPFDFGRRSH